ncbi:MAG: dTDP-4-dehydrorhamnose 3,5-epimerase [Fermentimonas sp.]|jgi:dTDP-4-dehydrorhamnose 3,5-epimerase
MEFIRTDIEGLVLIKPKIFSDNRGYFFESFSQREFENNVSDTIFVQDNESYSKYGVLRGLHFQKGPYAQAKLVRVVKGNILDVVVDIRPESPTFLKHYSVELSDYNKMMLYIPRGFAHGFVVLSEDAIFQYKCDNYYHPDSEGAIRWDDPLLGIDWILDDKDLILSDKDKMSPFSKDCFEL